MIELRRVNVSEADCEAAANLAKAIRTHLLEGVLPFWEKYSVESDGAGFWPHLARDGSRLGDGSSSVVAIARLTYSFSTAAELTGEERFRKYAQNGAQQLLRFYHGATASWCWRVARNGVQENTTVRPYGAAFAIYALATAGRVCGVPEFVDRAADSASVLWEKGRESRLGGFWHELTPEWMPTSLYHRLDTHLHAMEACSALWAATDDRAWKDRWRDLALYVAARAYDSDHGCMREQLLPDGLENLPATGGFVNYGHNLEAAWFLMVSAGVLEEPCLADIGVRLLEFVLEEGDDLPGELRPGFRKSTMNGVEIDRPFYPAGFRSSGIPGANVAVRFDESGDEAENSEYIWWVQAEALGALATAYQHRPQRQLLIRLQHLWASVQQLFYDPVNGAWFSAAARDGTVLDDTKGGDWKAAYHVTQACVHAAAAVDGLHVPGQAL